MLDERLSYGKPPEGGVSTSGETLAKKLNMERPDVVFGRQPDASRSGRGHQWLSGDLTGENFPVYNHSGKTTDIVVFISGMGSHSHFILLRATE